MTQRQYNFWLRLYKVLPIIGILFVVLYSSTFQKNIIAFGSNHTDTIAINVSQSQNKLSLEYLITQTFEEASHGIFLALPKNQEGVWTQYHLQSVEITDKISEPDAILDTSRSNNPTNFHSAPYQSINEWNQFRIRVGDPDQTLNQGQYIYKIKLETTIADDVFYNITLLQDWQDPVTKISLSLNNQDLCNSTTAICSQVRTTLSLNENKSSQPIWKVIVSEIWAYLIGILSLYLLLLLLWYRFARDPQNKTGTETPEFEPPDVRPWHAQFLINEGHIGLKNTLLSYVLWLNHSKFIELKGDESEIKLTLLKTLPQELPTIFNQAVEDMARSGVKKGLLDSKINPGQHEVELNKLVLNQVKQYYAQKPLSSPWIIGLLIGVGGLIAIPFGYNLFQTAFLIGESYLTLVMISYALALPGLFVLTKYWGRLTTSGAELQGYCKRYKFYLEKAEQFKLDFSNNPRDGVQYYLSAVPFAAAFGILPTFQKYIAKLIPQALQETQITNGFTYGYLAASFYSPPSSSDSSFDGGSSGGFSGGGGSW